MNDKSVLIIDDHPLFRKGVKQLLELEGRFDIIGEAANGTVGLELASKLNPDIILLDLNMKEMSGLDVLQALKINKCRSTVVVLTVSDQESDIAQAIRLGVDGYLLKDMEPELIVQKLSQVTEGQVVLDDTVTTLLANIFKENDDSADPTHVNLTDRENEILQLLVNGLNNKLMAKELNISNSTVKVHVKNIMRKIRVTSRLEAALWAINRNFSNYSELE